MTEISAPSTSTLHGTASASGGLSAPPADPAPPWGPAPATASRAVRASGATTTTDAVIATLAGLAAREVPGVHDLGTPTGRALAEVGRHIPGSSRGGCPGVEVEVGERHAAVEVAVVTELGQSAPEVADHVRAAVARALRELVGLEVTAVDVEVVDVAVPAG
ncbi:Asp23/Gls24 family envelope stress response protein [Streptomyces sp. NP160]|uniref:Asp23/Gls24 family envelope stress response protein n=1 Tax=Streptomyces sp. NP160 TaxID=2586637 RepID=UPI00111877A7|nr:Asp23/Gls24 family envelope stress response protein [Streptomyces sp. NP160]TNM70233.1 Asp23/Gls24 family envelope stress response protein [Streptomyces sp. NP160]